MNLQERINAAIKYSGKTQGAIAAQVRDMEEGGKFSQQQLSQLALGEDQATSYITHIAIACGVRPEWLAANQGEMVATSPRLQAAQGLLQSLSEKDLDAFFRSYGYAPDQQAK